MYIRLIYTHMSIVQIILIIIIISGQGVFLDCILTLIWKCPYNVLSQCSKLNFTQVSTVHCTPILNVYHVVKRDKYSSLQILSWLYFVCSSSTRAIFSPFLDPIRYILKCFFSHSWELKEKLVFTSFEYFKVLILGHAPGVEEPGSSRVAQNIRTSVNN